MIRFDLEDRYADEPIVGSAISRREGVVYSVVFHATLLGLLIWAPQLPLFQLSPEERAEMERQRQEQLQRQRENNTFVFVQPKIDMPAQRPPQRAELSDVDRQSQAPRQAPAPQNPLPFSRGNSANRVDPGDAERMRGPERPDPAEAVQPQPQVQRTLPPAESAIPAPSESRPTPPAGGALGEALRNLQKYVQKESFENPQGGAKDPGATIQFDTKGVEFGPWIRRFVAQVRRNWFIPMAAMTFKGRVVLQFNIHRNGRITDVAVVGPSDVDAFNKAAYNAIITSSPTEPLPPEYPDDKAFFTVTFYYNEQPPGQ